MTAINELYLVQNGVDDVVDTDHNTLVESVQFINDAFGGTYNFGNGKDGNLKIGVISPNATTAPTCIASGTGNLTGVYYYKYNVYNLSGETTASSASTTVSATSQYVSITIPPFSNNNNVTGFNIYRSVDDITYYKVGSLPVDDATIGGVFVDNIPMTSGSAPSGSNTTSTSATVYGTYYAKSVDITSGTLTLHPSYPFLNIICQGEVTFNGTFNGSNLVSGGAIPDYISPIFFGGTSSALGLTTQGANYVGAGTVSTETGLPIFKYTSQAWKLTSKFMYKQGEGGIGGVGPAGKAGGTLFIAAKGKINLSSANISLNGGNGTASTSDAGGGGGVCVCASSEYILLSGTTISANGGNASTGVLSTYPAAGGGGGGLVFMITDNTNSRVIGSPTITVNGGSGGSANGAGSGTGAGGGGSGGGGGAPVTNTSAGNPGSVGLSNYFSSNQISIPLV